MILVPSMLLGLKPCVRRPILLEFSAHHSAALELSRSLGNLTSLSVLGWMALHSLWSGGFSSSVANMERSCASVTDNARLLRRFECRGPCLCFFCTFVAAVAFFVGFW